MERAASLVFEIILLLFALGFFVYGVMVLFDYAEPFTMKTVTFAACLTFANMFKSRKSAGA